jgi:hypothetical protein
MPLRNRSSGMKVALTIPFFPAIPRRNWHWTRSGGALWQMRVGPEVVSKQHRCLFTIITSARRGNLPLCG